MQEQALNFLCRQISQLVDIEAGERDVLAAAIPAALDTVQKCARQYENPLDFSVLHASLMCIFIQYVRQSLQHTRLYDILYLVIRSLYSVDMFSATLPPYVYFEHPVATVIGRAKLHEYLGVFQNVTIGGTTGVSGNLEYPTLDKHVVLFAYSAVLGKSTIGSYSVLNTGTRVINEDIPSHSLVCGASPHLVIKPLAFERYAMLSPFKLSGTEPAF